MRDPVRRQPITQPQQAPHGRRELRDILQPAALAVGHPDRRGHLRLVNIEPRDALVKLIEHLLHHITSRRSNTVIAREAP
jgi:hypothetical protein